ncbi:MAG: DUF3108 domain-containing protein [Proteobacteria bacterium]|nr:DUF3108 domain-containing protein [Pseudomonadota bacterium]
MTPSRQQRLTAALLFSLLLHLTMLGAPGWMLPTLDDPLDTEPQSQIEAHLSNDTVRKVPVPAARPPPVMRRQKSSLAPVATQPSSAEQGVEHPAASPPLPQAQAQAPDTAEPKPAVVAPAVPATPESPLPRHGHIRFAITRGDQGFVIGQSLHRWSHDGKTYIVSNVTETTGLAALFKPVQVTQTSAGDITEEGLRPREFRTGKNGVAGDTARFDWNPMTLALSAGNPREVALKPGAQDMLSMFYQLSAKYPWVPRDRNEVMVATGRKFERYAFEVLREEPLPTRLGELRTLHLRTAAGVEAIDIWSALDLRGLPVKIRYTDREGESFDQIAEEIEFDGMPSPSGKR